MKIGILGSGDVGRRLADGFIELGHIVKIGSRNPRQEKITEWMAKHDKAKVSSGTFAEAASFGELDLIATLWAGTADAIEMADPKNLAGKVVIDVTNPLDFSKGMPPRLAIGHTDSAGETVQRMLPDSKGETIDIGGIEGARLLEPLAFLWIMHYFRTGNGNHAFKLLRK
jgi:8-hydroxy-5-deazaflavin:NADPH oxidoreductase